MSFEDGVEMGNREQAIMGWCLLDQECHGKKSVQDALVCGYYTLVGFRIRTNDSSRLERLWSRCTCMARGD
jgi:hypothetical protein